MEPSALMAPRRDVLIALSRRFRGHGDQRGLAPPLVVVPAQDAVADHGRRYAERLREAGTSVRLAEHPGAKRAFLVLPGVEPQAEAAQAEILAFLRAALSAAGCRLRPGRMNSRPMKDASDSG